MNLDYKNVINPYQTEREKDAQSKFLDKMFAAIEKREVAAKTPTLGPKGAEVYARAKRDVMLGLYQQPRHWKR
jgi:hypothetical protein